MVEEFLAKIRKEFGGGDEKSVKIAKLRRLVSEFKIVDSNYFLFSIFLSSHLSFPFSVIFIFGDLGLGSRWHHHHTLVT